MPCVLTAWIQDISGIFRRVCASGILIRVKVLLSLNPSSSAGTVHPLTVSQNLNYQ